MNDDPVAQETGDGPTPWVPGLVSVILPARNARRTIDAQLEALASQTYRDPWELIIVDDGSTDGTAEVARSWGHRLANLSIVETSGRNGVNVARNAGAAAASGDLYLFCDADDIVDPRWIEAIVRAGDSGEVLGGWYDDMVLDERLVRPQHRSDRLPVAMGFLPYALGGNLAVRASVFDELGGFREEYGLGGDDVEFCWRAQLASHRLSFVPDAVVRYRHREGLRAFARQYYHRGQARPLLYRDFRTYGVPRKRVRGAIRAWGWVAVHVFYVFAPHRRSEWVRRASVRLGMLRGSIRHRVVCL